MDHSEVDNRPNAAAEELINSEPHLCCASLLPNGAHNLAAYREAMDGGCMDPCGSLQLCLCKSAAGQSPAPAPSSDPASPSPSPSSPESLSPSSFSESPSPDFESPPTTGATGDASDSGYEDASPSPAYR